MNSATHPLNASPAPGSTMLTGLAASSGIARGPAYVWPCGDPLPIPRRSIAPGEVPAELSRLETALTEVEAELVALRDETRRNLGDDSAAIFEAQACLLRDPELGGAVTRRCREQR